MLVIVSSGSGGDSLYQKFASLLPSTEVDNKITGVELTATLDELQSMGHRRLLPSTPALNPHPQCWVDIISVSRMVRVTQKTISWTVKLSAHWLLHCELEYTVHNDCDWLTFNKNISITCGIIILYLIIFRGYHNGYFIIW